CIVTSIPTTDQAPPHVASRTSAAPVEHAAPSVDRWTLAAGATVTAAGTRFAVWAPAARRVAVRHFDAHGTAIGDTPLTPSGRGEFVATLPEIAAGADYAFVLDD